MAFSQLSKEEARQIDSQQKDKRGALVKDAGAILPTPIYRPWPGQHQPRDLNTGAGDDPFLSLR